jgi:hypothetical protein
MESSALAISESQFAPQGVAKSHERFVIASPVAR